MRLTVRAGRSIGAPGRLFNGARALAPLVLTLAGCTADPPPMTAADAARPTDAHPADAAVDAAPVAAVPVAPFDLLRRMPAPPAPIVAVPGDRAAGLAAARTRLRPSAYTPRVLVEHPTEGAFSMVHYQLTPDGDEVAAVLATFVPAYAAPERRDALHEAIARRLGPGEPLPAGPYRGTRWTTLPFRVELREDTATGDLELAYHRRGRADPLAPDPP